MGETQTQIVDLQKLRLKNNSSLVICLMMAFNDLSIANNGLNWSEEFTSPTQKHLSLGMGQYFIRLQISHLYEALDIIDEISNIKPLMKIVDSCSDESREAFKRLMLYTPKGSKRKWFTTNLGMIRNNLSFHYHKSGKLIDRALTDRASRLEARFSTVTRGSELPLSRFNIADDIIDTIFCRTILCVPRNKNQRLEVDLIMDSMFAIFKDIINFSGEFIYRFID